MTTEASTPTTRIVKIKKEDQGEEIKNFAETAMNELLGWYGYEGLDRLDLSSRTSCSTTHIVSDSSVNNETNSNGINRQDDNTTSNHETSRENSRSPCSIKKLDKQDLFCGWCRREVPENSPEFLTTPDGPRYCSESCFTQSRRASFKRAKTCDWCRHVRHAVSYVDFQDGASQLQFCSDKCLNQYKMQIFCKETQAHLDMNPHLREKGLETNSGLITPDLWLKNCRSRSVSPVSELSKSRSPTPPSQRNQTSTSEQIIQKPIISVAPVSKLISKNSNILNIRHLTKHTRKRRTSRGTNSLSKNNLNSSVNENNNTVLNLASQDKDMQTKILVNQLKTNSHSNVQGLCLKVPFISSADTTAPNLSSFPEMYPPSCPNSQNTYQSRLPFSPNPSCQSRLFKLPFSSSSSTNTPTQSSHTFPGASVPPITVMIPYPVIVPLPIPIPIPLPILDFLKANKPKDERAAGTTSESNLNEPLDFTTSKTPPESKDLTNENFDDLNCHDLSNSGSDNESHTFHSKLHSKFKITRLYAKRLIAKESEKNRPLRKRKRITDYLRSSKDDSDNYQHKE